MNALSPADEFRKRLKVANDLLGIHIESVHPRHRTIPLSYAAHVRGWHPVRPDHPAVPFESKLESEAISALARYPEMMRIQSQPVTVVYWHDGRIRHYTPDFHVSFASVPKHLARLGFGVETFIEVKPLLRACRMEAKLSVRFAVIREAAMIPIVLLTDWDLVQDRREVCYGA